MRNRDQRKYLIILLIAFLLFSILPVSNGIAETTVTPPTRITPEPPQQVTANAIPDVINSNNSEKKKPSEEIGLRKANEKVLNNHDGTFTKKIFGQPVHLKKNGKWEEIETDLIVKDGNEYKPKNTELDVSFLKRMKDGQYVEFQEKNYNLSVKLLNAFGEQGTIKANSVDATVEGNKIWYKQIFPNIDLRNVIFNDSVKEDIVLNQYTGHNEFQFEINTDLKPETNENGSISFVDEQGNEIYNMPKPFMSDSNIHPESGEAAFSDNVTYEIKETKKNLYLISLVADVEWLKSPERKFPIYIDPTYTKFPFRNIVNGYVTSAYPNNNYSGSRLWDSNQGAYTLKVGYYGSGDYYAYLKANLADLQGAIINKATLWLYTKWSYSTTPTNVWVSTANWDWTPSTITWNYSPSVTNLGYASAVRDSWFSFDVTSTVQQWANYPDSNYGFALHTNGNGTTYWKKFIASEQGSTVPEIEITFTFLDKPAPPTITPYPNGTNSSTGYFDLSWNKVYGADYYRVGIYNGKSTDWIRVDDVNSWSTRGKGLFPTTIDLQNGRYGIRIEGGGLELANDPSGMYTVSGGNYQTSKQYWFVVQACNDTSGYCSPESDWAEAYLPDTTSPNIPDALGVSITDGAINSGGTA
jgi:hypothetical protein